MKRMYYFLATAAILAVVGCAKEAEKEIVNPEGNKVTLRACVEDSETRVSIGNDYAFAFQSGDKVSVLTTDGAPVEFETSDSGTTAVFEGTFGVGETIGSFALYPASENHEADGKEVLFFMNEELIWKADESYMPMLGKVVDGNITFKAVGGVMKLIVYNIPSTAAHLQFTATNKKISGEFEIADASVVNPVIVTASKNASDDTIFIDFSEDYSTNKVFYIPLPTGTIDGFTISFLDGSFNDIEGASRTTTASLNVTRNKIILAPALDMVPAVDDAMLTNSEIINSNLIGNYPTSQSQVVTISNKYGDWSVSGIKGGNYRGSGNYFVQIRKADNNQYVSYIKLPTFENNIATVVLQEVVNIREEQFTGTAYFRSEANNSGPIIASGTATEAFGDITLTIPSGHKTGYIMTDGPLLISSINVTFSGGSAVVPTITVGDEECTINAGNKSASINNVILNNPLDGNGIVATFSDDWIKSATINDENRLVITATDYNHTEEVRTAIIRLLATGASKTVTVKQNPSIVPSPTNLTAETGNATFTVSWTGDNKAKSYVGFYGTSALSDPTTGVPLTISNEGNNFTGVPSGAVENGTTYYVYVKVNEVADASAGKYAASSVWATTTVKPVDPGSGHVFTASELTAGSNTAQIQVNQLLGYRLGTSSNDGSVTIPAGYSTITFYGVGWKSGSKTLSLTNATFATGSPTSLAANEKATGTISGGTSMEIDEGVQFTITVTDSSQPVVVSGHRSILWNFLGQE